MVLASRYPALREAVGQAGHAGGWRTTTWLARCLGFVLGLIGASLLGGMLSPLSSPLIVAGVLLVLVAEFLVAQRRVYRSGIEEAVYLCGAVALVVQLLIWSDGDNESLGVAMVAGAVLYVGWRLLNPLFTTLAAAGFSLAVATIGTSLLGGRMQSLAAAIFCIGLAVAALSAGARQWQRPSHDRMVDGLVIVMPWMAHLWLSAWSWQDNVARTWATLIIAVVFLVMNLVLGLRRRQHAPLIGALGNVVCVAHALHELLHWPQHWRLIAGGAVLLAAAAYVDRRLRGRESGVVARELNDASGLGLAELAAAAHLAPAPGSPPPAGVQGQGGGFGGGGATGRF